MTIIFYVCLGYISFFKVLCFFPFLGNCLLSGVWSMPIMARLTGDLKNYHWVFSRYDIIAQGNVEGC